MSARRCALFSLSGRYVACVELIAPAIHSSFFRSIILAVAYDSPKYVNKGQLFQTLGKAGFVTWAVLAFLLDGFLPYLGVRQHFQWGGLSNIISTLLWVASMVLFIISFKHKAAQHEKFPWHWYLMISMALFLFVERTMVAPNYKQLYHFFRGKIDTHDTATPIAGVSNKVLKRVARDAGVAVGISGEESLSSIEQALAGIKIRQDPEDALDDWALVLNKLGTVTSIFPCRKNRLSTAQYRDLARQMLLFLRSYVKTGKISSGEANQKRTLPLSVFESLKAVLAMSWSVKWSFLLAQMPGFAFSVLGPLAGPMSGEFVKYVTAEWNPDKATKYFWLMMGTQVIAAPVLNFLTNLLVSKYSTNLSDVCRRRMLNVMVKGGTQFEETHRSGKLNDGFSNQVK